MAQAAETTSGNEGGPKARPLPLLVLLPGLDGTGRLFAPLRAVLQAAERAETIAYPADAPLDPTALGAWIAARLPRGEPFLLVAESFSGPLAMALAAAAPPDLVGLVLVATFCESPRRPPRWLVRLLLPWLVRYRPPKLALRWLLLGLDAPRALARDLGAAIDAVAPTVLAQRVRDVLATDARTGLLGVRLPVLYLQAAHDRVVPARCGRGIAALGRGVEVVAVRAPHLLLQRAPAEALARIRGWWWAQPAPAPRRPTE